MYTFSCSRPQGSIRDVPIGFFIFCDFFMNNAGEGFSIWDGLLSGPDLDIFFTLLESVLAMRRNVRIWVLNNNCIMLISIEIKSDGCMRIVMLKLKTVLLVLLPIYQIEFPKILSLNVWKC